MAKVGINGTTAGKIDADARLIAEAGTVASETGLTPRQLADQRTYLLDALRGCALVMKYDLNGLAVIQPELRAALAAIKKATGETQ